MLLEARGLARFGPCVWVNQKALGPELEEGGVPIAMRGGVSGFLMGLQQQL